MNVVAKHWGSARWVADELWLVLGQEDKPARAPTTEPEPVEPRENWAKSDVHKASQYYCAHCGRQFAMPHDLYEHLDREHGER